MWNFPPARWALILEKKLIEQKGAFHPVLSRSLLKGAAGGDPFRGSLGTHLCFGEAETGCFSAIALQHQQPESLGAKAPCVAPVAESPDSGAPCGSAGMTALHAQMPSFLTPVKAENAVQ